MSLSLHCYHCLPAPLQAAVASARGYHLHWWRYGRGTDRLVEEALAREHWTHAQWCKWQQEQLAFILTRAATCVPYYREYWKTRRRKGDQASWEELQSWPVLEKEPVRDQPKAFLAADVNSSRMFYEHTSGTTGKPLDLWFSRHTVQAWYALVEARWRRWYGVDRNSRWAILGGQLVAPVSRRRPPFWVWNRGLNQLYLSSYHLAPDLIPYYVDALHRYAPAYLVGYTSSLFALATEVLRAGLSLPPLRVVITNAEPVYDYQRQTIAQAFRCPVRETYGMCETLAGASECEAGHLHLWPEAGVMEVVQNDQPVRRGAPGELLCTGLLNHDMPLIRYRVGDRAGLPELETRCKCGRTLPLLEKIEGRTDDVLYTPEGRMIGRLDPVFKARLPIREAQVIQTHLDKFTVRYLPAGRFTDSDGQLLISRLQERLGDVSVTLEQVAEIPRTSNGKFRAVVCNLSPPEIEALRKGKRLQAA